MADEPVVSLPVPLAGFGIIEAGDLDRADRQKQSGAAVVAWRIEIRTLQEP